MIKTQFNTQIQILQSDNGKEFFNSFLSNYLSNEGIIHQSTCVDTPQQNGIAGRKNRHLLEDARSLMFSSNVPKHFWREAILTATFLINRSPSRVLNYLTPCQVFYKIFSQNRLLTNISPGIFGCTVFIHAHSNNRRKLDDLYSLGHTKSHESRNGVEIQLNAPTIIEYFQKEIKANLIPRFID
ncbi:hypothetical protein ACOSQ3_019652 [Xanthoceras sorbifolium]